MTNRKLMLPVLAGAAGAAAASMVFYWLRRSRSLPPTGNATEQSTAPRELTAVQSLSAADTPQVNGGLALDGVFDVRPSNLPLEEDETSEATVQCDVHVPPFASGDDAEPPGPEELGLYWLNRATDAERSFDESDLALDLENIANPDQDLVDDIEWARDEGEGEPFSEREVTEPRHARG